LIDLDLDDIGFICHKKYLTIIDEASVLRGNGLGNPCCYLLLTNVSASGFGNPALDGDGVSTLSLTTSGDQITGTKVTLNGTQAEAVTGAAGKTTANLGYKLDIKPGTLLNKGTFVNTVTWNLANTPGANADGDVTPANAE
jgi:hypothetical protein